MVKYMWICMAHRRKHAFIRLMLYRFPYIGADLRLTSPQPDTSQHRGYGLVYHAMCLFTSRANLETGCQNSVIK